MYTLKVYYVAFCVNAKCDNSSILRHLGAEQLAIQREQVHFATYLPNVLVQITHNQLLSNSGCLGEAGRVRWVAGRMLDGPITR